MSDRLNHTQPIGNPLYTAITPSQRGWDEFDEAETYMSTKTVLDTIEEPIFTGLLDINGVPLYRVEEKQKVGYI